MSHTLYLARHRGTELSQISQPAYGASALFDNIVIDLQKRSDYVPVSVHESWNRGGLLCPDTFRSVWGAGRALGCSWERSEVGNRQKAWKRTRSVLVGDLTGGGFGSHTDGDLLDIA